jgi:drug/metabolite transporter (DMT)-like permease
MSAGPAAAPASVLSRRFPPVAELAVVSLASVVVGGILMASYAPRRPPLGVPVALALAGAVLLAASGYVTSRLRRFAWDRFFLVFRWGLLAYVISAGMIAFAFVKDHTRGAPLAVVLAMLVIYALDVPLIIAFTAARYASPPDTGS